MSETCIFSSLYVILKPFKVLRSVNQEAVNIPSHLFLLTFLKAFPRISRKAHASLWEPLMMQWLMYCWNLPEQEWMALWHRNKSHREPDGGQSVGTWWAHEPHQRMFYLISLKLGHIKITSLSLETYPEEIKGLVSWSLKNSAVYIYRPLQDK